MASVNKVLLLGNLGKDVETRYTTAGEAVSNVSLATSETWTDKKSGEKKQSVEWHSLSFFGRQAEVAAEFLKKGSQIFVEGRIKTRKWQAKDGSDRWTTEIHVDRMQMLDKKPSGEKDDGAVPTNGGDYRAAKDGAPAPAPARTPSGPVDDLDDDIPF